MSDYQGRSPKQVKSSETIAGYGILVLAAITLFLLIIKK